MRGPTRRVVVRAAIVVGLLALVPAAADAQQRESRLDEVFHGIQFRSAAEMETGAAVPSGDGTTEIVSPHDPSLRYRVDDAVHRSTDGGVSWTAVSPSLAPGGLAAVAESPLEPGLLWAGGRDGSLHLTRDGGLSWETLTGPAPDGTFVRALVASAHDGGIAYVVAGTPPDEPQMPLLVRYEGYGREYDLVIGTDSGFPGEEPVTAFAEDPENPDLFFVGSRLGAYVSFNGALAWDRLSLGMPEADVTELTIYGRDLLVDTRGHGRFVLEGIAPLRYVVEGLMSGEPYLFAPTPVHLEDRAVAYLDYLLPSFVGSVRIEVLDVEGRVLATLAAGGRDVEGRRLPGARAGVHRLVWDLSVSPDGDARGAANGRSETCLVSPGAYALRMSVDGLVRERVLEVVAGPS
ncbi:MAG: hypothetical protein WD101_04575 [Gemmatimonadota bacterium]